MALNGTRTFSEEKFMKMLKNSKGKPVTFSVIRGIDSLSVQSLVSDSGTIGIRMNSFLGDYPLTDYRFGSALAFGASDAIDAITTNIKGLKRIFIGKENASDSLQGPIGIAKFYGGIWDWHRFWYITGLLSMILAFMNILPIPALDGGHGIFLLVEAATRRKFSDKVMENAQMAGMIILLSLMAFAVGNDIWKHIVN